MQVDEQGLLDLYIQEPTKREFVLKVVFKDFLNEVEKMRNCQKEFFKTKDKIVLINSKSQEKKIDELIQKYKNFKEE